MYVILSQAGVLDQSTILNNCPRLEVDDLVACLEYAAVLATGKVVYA